MIFKLNHYTKFLTSQLINEAAIESNFKQRNIGIPPEAFVSVILNPNFNVASESLTNFTTELSKLGYFVTRQSIHERIDESCCEFFQILFKKLVEKTKNNLRLPNLGVFSNFKNVLIADSTSITLDPIHNEKFPGLSMKLKAVVKILASIDPTNLSINTFELAEGKYSDQNLNEHLYDFSKNTLILKDLGFTSVKDQQKITSHNGKYISRVKLDTDLYIPSTNPRYNKFGKIIENSRFEKIDIPKFYCELAENEVVDKKYFFKNGKDYYSHRVIITKIPKEKLEFREKSAASKIRDCDHKISDKARSMLPFNLYTTNLPAEKISAEYIHTIYSKRWDIELVFKKLKSTYNINDVKIKVKIERILIQIYSKLILFALDCLYTRELIEAIPEIPLSYDKIGKFLKKYLSTVYMTGKSLVLETKFLEHLLKKDIKKSRNKP